MKDESLICEKDWPIWVEELFDDDGGYREPHTDDFSWEFLEQEEFMNESV